MLLFFLQTFQFPCFYFEMNSHWFLKTLNLSIAHSQAKTNAY